MRSRSKILCSVVIVSAFAIDGCNNTVFAPPVYLGVTVSPRPATVPVGTTVVFTGTVSNNLSLPLWSILDAADANNAGTLTPVTGSIDSIVYTAPVTPPIYSVTPTGVTQGTVTLNATTTDPAGTSIPITGDAVTFVITAPSVTVNLSPTTATVARTASQQFIGYAVGNVNNTLIWSLDGFVGGAVPVPLSNPVTYTYPYGTINAAGTYVAPASLPSGNAVTLTIFSQADPTKTAFATVNLL